MRFLAWGLFAISIMTLAVAALSGDGSQMVIGAGIAWCLSRPLLHHNEARNYYQQLQQPQDRRHE